MEAIQKLCAMTLTGALLALLLRKQNAELALLIVLGTGILLMRTALTYWNTVSLFLQELCGQMNGTEVIGWDALFRATAVSVMVHLTTSLCRDAGETALAVRLELCGTAICIVLMLPTLTALLSLIGGLLEG